MKRVLFVCVENSCRSQMAEALARDMGKGAVEAYSAGSKPSGSINPGAVTAMREIGIEMTGQRSKGFSELGERHFDYVITLGCGDVCPVVPAAQHIHWEIDDPKGKSIDAFRRARDEIMKKVEAFIPGL